MKRAIFITVRTSSTRLPRKCLLKINGVMNIEFLIRRLKRSKRCDFIVLCTTINPEDDILCEIAKKEGVEFFRGSENDKLDRWLKATEKFNVDFFVTADGDDLFCDPFLIDMAFDQFEKSKCDFIEEKPSSSVPVGAFTYGIKVEALKRVCEMKATDETEMMSVYFTETKIFKVEPFGPVPEIYRRPEIRMTLDYSDDFLFFKNIIEYFGNRYFAFEDIIEYLNKNPHIIEINQHLNKDYLLNQKNKTKMVLK